MRLHRTIAVAALVLLSFVAAPRAFGHAARATAEPEVNARLDDVPQTVTVSYTEPPADSAVFRVFDGCGNNVVDDLEVQNSVIEATLIEGQPGRWSVEWRVLSVVDGHDTRDGYSFRVAGESDCSQTVSTRPPSGDDDEDDPGPGAGVLLPIAIGGVVLGAVAFFLRGRSS